MHNLTRKSALLGRRERSLPRPKYPQPELRFWALGLADARPRRSSLSLYEATLAHSMRYFPAIHNFCPILGLLLRPRLWHRLHTLLATTNGN